MVRLAIGAGWLATLTVFGCFGCGEDPPQHGPAAALGGQGGEAGDGPCQPRTCETNGVVCGQLDDGCGQIVVCGDGCAAGGSAGVAGADGEGPGCVPGEPTSVPAPSRTSRRAKSSGFAGSAEQYGGLYDVPCEGPSDCVTACVEAGGIAEACDFSECTASGLDDAKTCLPVPVWTNVESLQTPDDDPVKGAQLVVIFSTYHDVLLADQFALELPKDALIRGVEVEARKAGDESVFDDSVQLISHGILGSAERASEEPWRGELEWVRYGSPDDLWGLELTADDVMADDFGVGLAVVYADTAGNSRAYVDQVRVTVYYEGVCE